MRNLNKTDNLKFPRLRHSLKTGLTQTLKNWKILTSREIASHTDKTNLFGFEVNESASQFMKHIEYFMGAVSIPLAIIGPLKVNGVHADGHYYIPLATTEGAMAASYSRGAQLITRSGGCSSALISDQISRTPIFKFANLEDAIFFSNWINRIYDQIKEAAESTTQHGKLVSLSSVLEGRNVFLIFNYTTGDASGQNMTTIATKEAFDFILMSSPVKPSESYIEGNLSGDKKASQGILKDVRGKKVISEVTISKEDIKRYLFTTPQDMSKVWENGVIGGILNGNIGAQCHYANALAAIYLATGQDVACVAESSVGITRVQVTESGDLYISVTLPNIMVGTIGGGTNLPSQKASLNILGMSGAGKSKAFAEICASVCLAGEISLLAAITAGHFANAHGKLGRRNKVT